MNFITDLQGKLYAQLVLKEKLTKELADCAANVLTLTSMVAGAELQRQATEQAAKDGGGAPAPAAT